MSIRKAYLGVYEIGGGSYPAFYISSFQPAQALKGGLKIGSGGASFRKGLVVFQFTISIALIISTTVVYLQTQHMQQQDLGYNEELLVNVSIFFPNPSLQSRAETVKQAFLRHENILNVSACLPPLPGAYTQRGVVRPEGGEGEGWQMQLLGIDDDFLDTYEIELVAGRNIDLSLASDSTEAFILNEAAVEKLGWENPIGKRISWGDREGYVIGVVKDFNSQLLHRAIEPIAMLHNWKWTLALRISSQDMAKTLAFIEETWAEFVPDRPPNYFFLDQWIEDKYQAERRLGESCGLFALLAIFVAGLGLLGLASYTVEQRRQEMGVRKVLGASSIHIASLFSRSFIIPILIANMVAWPVAYYAMDEWLQTFAYRIGLGIGPFLFSSTLTLVIAVVTVTYQAAKVGSVNPVKALKSE